MAQTSKHQIHVENLDATIRELRRAGGKQTVKAMKVAGKTGATIVATEAKTLVPVVTGALKRSISATATSTKGVVKAGTARTVPYAGPIHFGWPAHNIAPQPFIYDAMDKRANEVRAAYALAMDKVAIEASSRGAP